MPLAPAALIALGFLVGAFGTLIGAGGGFLLVPVLALLYPAEDPGTLTGISLLVVAVNALSGSVAYARMGRIDFRAGTWFAVAAVPGAILGAWASTLMSRRLFEALLGSLMLVAAVWLLARAHRPAVAGGAGGPGGPQERGGPGASRSTGAPGKTGGPRRPSGAGDPAAAGRVGGPFGHGHPEVPREAAGPGAGVPGGTGAPGQGSAPAAARREAAGIGSLARAGQGPLWRGMVLSFLVGVVSSLLGIGGGIIHVDHPRALAGGGAGLPGPRGHRHLPLRPRLEGQEWPSTPGRAPTIVASTGPRCWPPA